jgi:hypothetical protein
MRQGLFHLLLKASFFVGPQIGGHVLFLDTRKRPPLPTSRGMDGGAMLSSSNNHPAGSRRVKSMRARTAASARASRVGQQ